MHRTFVYGTLKKGEPNHAKYLVERPGSVQYLGGAKTVEKFPLVVASRSNLPFLLYAPGQGKNVIGEVYDVDDVTLKNLDILEKHPDFYQRDTIRVRLEDITQSRPALDPVQECNVYFLKKFKPELLAMDFLESYANTESRPYVPGEDMPKGAESPRTEMLPSGTETATTGMNKVFVYGTLKKGQPNHFVITQNSKSVAYLGQARTVDKYPMVVASKYKVPFLLDAPGQGKNVTGDVYGMTDEMLKETDVRERHPNFYRRTRIRVKFFLDKNEQTFQEEEEVWAYLLINFKDETLAHDWLETFDAADHVVGSDVTQLPMGSSHDEVEAFFNDMRHAVQK